MWWRFSPIRPVPSDLCPSRSTTSGRLGSSGPTAVVNAILAPSGLHIGAPAPLVVAGWGSPPSAGSSQMSLSRRKAIVVPSGDQAGDESAVPWVSCRACPSTVSTCHSAVMFRSVSRSAVRSV
jgi:hypothetical protein